MSRSLTKNNVATLMEDIFYGEIMKLREAGQEEYSHSIDNAFQNFDRIAEELDMDRKKVLWVFAMKHKDGIASWLNGHKSQREGVAGRINDLIVYLFLLRAMIEADELDQSVEPGYLEEDTPRRVSPRSSGTLA
jgi:hypothetical protein